MEERRERLRRSRLYLVCGPQGDEFLNAVLRGGVDIVQLRMKSGADEETVATGLRFAARCASHGALFILNDRPDLVVAANADGVHLGQDDIAVTEARTILGEERLIGLSTHSPEQVDSAAGAAVDYIGVGPVHETPTKPGRPAVGVELVDYAAARTRLPFFAIGGISMANVGEVAAAGARRIAVVRALTNADDAERAACELRGAITSGIEVSVGAT